MQYRPNAGDTVEQLQMPVRIPRQRSEHFSAQHRRQPPSTGCHRSVGGADGFVVAKRNDLDRTVICRPMRQHGRQQQRKILIKAQHVPKRSPPPAPQPTDGHIGQRPRTTGQNLPSRDLRGGQRRIPARQHIDGPLGQVRHALPAVAGGASVRKIDPGLHRRVQDRLVRRAGDFLSIIADRNRKHRAHAASLRDGDALVDPNSEWYHTTPGKRAKA